MNKGLLISIVLLSLMIGLPLSVLSAEPPKASGPQDVLIVAGTISNAQGKGIKEAKLNFFLNGQKVEQKEEVVSGHSGDFRAEIAILAGTLEGGMVELEVEKPS